MIVNGSLLLEQEPIVGMAHTKMTDHGVSYGLSEAGYDIRIKQDITFIPQDWANGRIVVSGPVPRRGRRADIRELHGRFVLASTIEEFDMPDRLLGVVHDKSTWARHGLSVFNTVIEPGWKGFLTLELVYHGQERLYIPAGSGIAQVLFHRVCEPANYVGKYQNQGDEPVAPILVK